jgi:hypothetical protein
MRLSFSFINHTLWCQAHFALPLWEELIELGIDLNTTDNTGHIAFDYVQTANKAAKSSVVGSQLAPYGTSPVTGIEA